MVVWMLAASDEAHVAIIVILTYIVGQPSRRQKLGTVHSNTNFLNATAGEIGI